jgi:hypothetical protein
LKTNINIKSREKKDKEMEREYFLIKKLEELKKLNPD